MSSLPSLPSLPPLPPTLPPGPPTIAPSPLNQKDQPAIQPGQIEVLIQSVLGLAAALGNPPTSGAPLELCSTSGAVAPPPTPVGSARVSTVSVSTVECAQTQPAMDLPDASEEAQAQRSITLICMDGESISVDTRRDIPDPPDLSFKGGIDAIKRLNAMWDDDPAHWLGKVPFAIHGRQIPLVHWRALYGRQGQATWEHLKTSWNQWKVGASLATSVPERPDRLTDALAHRCWFRPSGATGPLNDSSVPSLRPRGNSRTILPSFARSGSAASIERVILYPFGNPH